MPTRIMTPRSRVRPQTTSGTSGGVNWMRTAASVARSSRRGLQSARARMRVKDPPPDLIPPEWTPLVLNLTTTAELDKHHDNGHTETGLTRAPNCSSSGSDDDVETLPGKGNEDGDDDQPPESPSRPLVPDADGYYGQDERPYIPEVDAFGNLKPPQLPTGRPKTNAQLKEFLAAAMESVRFFLVTSSIGQMLKEQKKADAENEDNDDDGDVEEPDPLQYNRSKLLIMNGALMEEPWRFSMETYGNDPDMLEYYTGFRSYEIIKSIFQLVKPSNDTLFAWQKNDPLARKGAFKVGVITLLDEFFLFLYKLRRNPSTEDLAVRFSMPEHIVNEVLDDWLHYLYGYVGRQAVWPSRDNVDIYMHTCYKTVCPCVRIVVHVANVRVRCSRELFPNSVVPAPFSGTGPSELDPGTKEGSEEMPNMQEVESMEDITVEHTQEHSAREPNLFSSPLDKPTQLPNPLISSQVAKKLNKTRRISMRKLNKKAQESQMQAVADKPVDELVINTNRTDNYSDKNGGHLMDKHIVEPDRDGVLSYKSLVVFQPTGAACMISKLYPTSTPSEQVLSEMGVVPLLEECDDVVTLDPTDNLDHNVLEELLHPYAANYMDINLLMGCMSPEDFRKRSPTKAHYVRCMWWHMNHSVQWVRSMMVWDELAELSPTWVKHIDRVWTVSCLLTNFLPSDTCLEVEEL